MKLGMTVKVFGSRIATVDAISRNGKNVHVSGADYTGWTSAANCKAVTA